VKVALSGCGNLALQVHLPLLRRLGVEVSALADPNPEALEQAAQRVPGARRCGSLEQLLEGFDGEAVLVASPPFTHGEAAVAILEAGHSVYLEKPLAHSLADGQHIQRVAQEARGLLMVGFNLRFHPLLVELGRRFRSGEIGELVLLRSAFHLAPGPQPQWRLDPKRGGGPMFELATHHLDLWETISGRQLQRLGCQASGVSLALQGQLEGGALVQGSFSLASAEEEVVELFGDRGRLRVRRYSSGEVEFAPLEARGERLRQLQAWLRIPSQWRYWKEKFTSPWHEPSYSRSLQAFFQSLRQGQLVAGAADVNAGLRNLEWLLQSELLLQAGP